MFKIITTLFILLSMFGCANMNKPNPNIKRSPERLAYEACKKKNNGDKSMCKKEKEELLDREEIELMDEAT
ncbi:MAG: hypothetical protein EBT06_06480 [Gammaproteobacteria bacterium]|jgi:hypothetical protein|nr:hypothetical protein [Gammaproteobacteria bacterium]NBT44557.1 hypothetical protein [Gammaproteobacteria bacterium]NBY21584.1 hypothetical protein [Gammaproteobacteria bacterium]